MRESDHVNNGYGEEVTPARRERARRILADLASAIRRGEIGISRPAESPQPRQGLRVAFEVHKTPTQDPAIELYVESKTGKGMLVQTVEGEDVLTHDNVTSDLMRLWFNFVERGHFETLEDEAGKGVEVLVDYSNQLASSPQEGPMALFLDIAKVDGEKLRPDSPYNFILVPAGPSLTVVQ